MTNCRREIPSTKRVRQSIDVHSAKVWRTIGLPFFCGYCVYLCLSIYLWK